MPNKYQYADPIEEEDREVENDLQRSQKKYYDSMTEINNIILAGLRDMSKPEIKEVIKNCGFRIPVEKL